MLFIQVEYSAVIQYLYLQGKTGMEIHVNGELEEVVMADKERVNGKDPDFFSSGLMALEPR